MGREGSSSPSVASGSGILAISREKEFSETRMEGRDTVESSISVEINELLESSFRLSRQVRGAVASIGLR